MKPNNRNNSAALERIYQAVAAIANMENKVPAALKQTFNFKGRKSVDVAKSVIGCLVEEGAAVCEPFAGSGCFVLGGLLSNVRMVACELDNYTYEADRVLLQTCDLQKVRTLFGRIKRLCYDEIMSYYETRCCGVINYIDKLHFDPGPPAEYRNPKPHRDLIDGKNIVMVQRCPVCGSVRKQFDDFDDKKLEEVTRLDDPRFPSHELMCNSRINITAPNADHYDRNFTSRAKASLLSLQDAINCLEPCLERDLLEHCLVASLPLSRIAQYGSGSEYIYQVMRYQAQEKNVWRVFEDKVENFIRFKESYAEVQQPAMQGPGLPLQFFNGDFRERLNGEEYREYFDLIYTDPPYTDQVPYLERSQLFRDWLQRFYDRERYELTREMLDREMVITDADDRPKKWGYDQYCRDLDQMYRLFYRILKPGGIVVLTIKLGTKKYLQMLATFIALAKKNGFEYAIKLGMDKPDPTLRKQAAWLNSLTKETLVFFTKLDEENRYWFQGDVNLDEKIVDLVYRAIDGRADHSLSLSACVQLVLDDLREKLELLATPEIQERIVKRIEQEFQVYHGYVYIDSNRLYLAQEDRETLTKKLMDVVPLFIRKLGEERGFELDDLYFEMTGYMLDGDVRFLSQVLEDDTHEELIMELLNRYCFVIKKKQYWLKKYQEEAPLRAGTDISMMDGYEFEELIKSLLMARGYEKVKRIGGANDRGVDIEAEKDGKSYIFQCKRWLHNVDGTPIQRLHSMMVQNHVDFAWCVTTSDFTRQAREEAANTGVHLMEKRELMALLEEAFPGMYYHLGLEEE